MAVKVGMRIGILTHNYPRRNSERKDAGIFIYDFAHELVKEHQVFVFCPDFGGKKEKDSKVPVTWFDWVGPRVKFGDWNFFNPLSVFYFFKLIFVGCQKAEEFARKNRVDYCLSAWTLPSSIFAYYLKKRLGIPYAAWSLGSDLNRYAKLPILRQLITIGLKEADARFANSYLLIDKVEKLSNRDCKFMPAITDFQVSKIKPAKVDDTLFNFLYVGRLEKIKGPDILAEALFVLSKKGVNFKMYLLGDGNLRDKLEERVARMGLASYVEFYGGASKEEVAAFMKACDTLIIPSRSESLPLVLLEAAKVGLPVIATDVGDCRRIIEKYKVGIVVPRENPEELATAMEIMRKRRRDVKKKYKKGLEMISKDFAQENAVRILLDSLGRK